MNMADTPDCWEDAAHSAATECLKRWDKSYGAFRSSPSDPLANVRQDVDLLRNVLFGDRGDEPARPFFESIGLQAVRGGNPSTQFVDDYVYGVADLIARKQHDYGHQNIAAFGERGLCVRLHDKVARLENLLERKSALALEVDRADDGVFGPLNESAADTWADILGYAIIGIMWCDSTFLLPLRADIPSVVPQPQAAGGPAYFDAVDKAMIRDLIEDTVVGGNVVNEWVLGVIDEQHQALWARMRDYVDERLPYKVWRQAPSISDTAPYTSSAPGPVVRMADPSVSAQNVDGDGAHVGPQVRPWRSAAEMMMAAPNQMGCEGEAA